MMDIYLDLLSVLISLFGGLVATLAMTIIEIPAWKRWGLKGVLEWHENQVLSTKFFKLPDNILHFKEIFLLHFVNGGLGGIGFLLMLWIFSFTSAGTEYGTTFLFAIPYGIFLWIATLIPLHKTITGISPWRHPAGIMPTTISLIGHVVYGGVLGLYTEIIFFRL